MTQEINLTEELERKTLDALALVMTEYQTGGISQPTAAFALRAIFVATSGLAGNEVFDLTSKASAEIDKDAKRDMVRRFFVHPAAQEMVLLEYQFGEAEVTLKRGRYPRQPNQVNLWEKSSRATFEHEVNPFEAARQRFTGFADSLARKGFQEIL